MKYLYTVDDAYFFNELISNDDDFERIAEEIAKEYLDGDSAKIADAEKYGLKIELFNTDKVSLGEFEISIQWIPYFTANKCAD